MASRPRKSFRASGILLAVNLSPEKPLLYLVAPAFHVHPQTDVLLRYISPEIEWEFVGIDEHWREGVKVVFRKRPGTRSPHAEAETRKTDETQFTVAI